LSFATNQNIMWNYTMVHLEEIFYIYNKDYFEIDSFNN
jgi:hypothetical protein